MRRTLCLLLSLQLFALGSALTCWNCNSTCIKWKEDVDIEYSPTRRVCEEESGCEWSDKEKVTCSSSQHCQKLFWEMTGDFSRSCSYFDKTQKELAEALNTFRQKEGWYDERLKCFTLDPHFDPNTEKELSEKTGLKTFIPLDTKGRKSPDYRGKPYQCFCQGNLCNTGHQNAAPLWTLMTMGLFAILHTTY